MTPRKRKSRNPDLEQEEKPEIALDLSEVEEAEAAQQKAKADRTARTRESVERIKDKEGVKGYIFRSAESASIDMKEPEKIIDYAFLSSSAFELCDVLSETFELGDIQHVLVEGNTTKFLSFEVEGNRISVFMEKKIEHKRVFKDLLS